jgi:hypothetical protein
MENNPEPLKFLTLQETAELLHLSRRTLQRMIRNRLFFIFSLRLIYGVLAPIAFAERTAWANVAPMRALAVAITCSLWLPELAKIKLRTTQGKATLALPLDVIGKIAIGTSGLLLAFQRVLELSSTVGRFAIEERPSAAKVFWKNNARGKYSDRPSLPDALPQSRIEISTSR